MSGSIGTALNLCSSSRCKIGLVVVHPSCQGSVETESAAADADTAEVSLESLVGDIARLKARKAALCDDIRRVLNRARSAGIDTGVLQQALRSPTTEAAALDDDEALQALVAEAVWIECHASWF